MLHRTFTRRATLAALLGSLATRVPKVAGSQAQAESNQTDIVLVVTDDMADADWRSLPKTARALGAVYPTFLTTTPTCAPSRATLLTGKYAHSHGVLRNRGATNAGWPAFRPHENETVAAALQRAGYRTAMIGKYMNEYDPDSGMRPGWNKWFATSTQTRKYFRWEAVDGNQLRQFGSESADYSVDVIARTAEGFIRDADPNRPLFAYVAPDAPHGPATVAPRFQGTAGEEAVPRTPSFNADPSGKPAYMQSAPLSERELDDYERMRQGSLKAVDDLVAGVVAALQRRGRPWNPIFVSDNGYLTGQHRRTGKWVPYEESVKIGMRATGPDFPHGTFDVLVTNADIPVTIAAIAGVAIEGADGVDVRPLGLPRREAVLLEGWDPGERDVRKSEEGDGGGSRVGEPKPNPPWAAARSKDAVYIETEQMGGPFQEFYDLVADPYQLRNVAETGERVPAYRAALAGLRHCTGASCNTASVSTGD